MPRWPSFCPACRPWTGWKRAWPERSGIALWPMGEEFPLGCLKVGGNVREGNAMKIAAALAFLGLSTACVLAASAPAPSCCAPAGKDFPKVGGDYGNQNYSSLAQITPENIAKLGAPGMSIWKAAPIPRISNPVWWPWTG